MKEAYNERCIAGQFSLGGSLTAAGELHLRGQASRLKLFSRSEPDWSAKRDVCGRLLDSTPYFAMFNGWFDAWRRSGTRVAGTA